MCPFLPLSLSALSRLSPLPTIASVARPPAARTPPRVPTFQQQSPTVARLCDQTVELHEKIRSSLRLNIRLRAYLVRLAVLRSASFASPGPWTLDAGLCILDLNFSSALHLAFDISRYFGKESCCLTGFRNLKAAATPRSMRRGVPLKMMRTPRLWSPIRAMVRSPMTKHRSMNRAQSRPSCNG